MNAKQPRLKITDGTSQADRLPEALAAGYIKPDELRFEDLLAMGADYAGILKFHDLNNEAEQSWAPFFRSDALFIFAKILTTDLAKIKLAFSEKFSELATTSDIDLKIIPSYQLAITIDYWFQTLKAIESDAGQKLFLIIKEIIADKLRMHLKALELFLDRSFIESNYDGIWSVAPADPKPSGPDDACGRGSGDDRQFLRANFAAFFNAALLIQESTRKLLPETLGSQIHNPAMGMYVAFIKLFQKVQQRLNRFTDRHLDFYYQDVLKIRPRKTIPDRAYLTFDTDTADREVLIGAGTEFLAGRDQNNNDIIYTANNDLLVTGARVASIYSLFMERDQRTSPESELGFITGAKINRIPVSEENGGSKDPRAQTWPIFGAPKSASQKRIYDEAELGFAMASPILVLNEGERDITITFKIESTDPNHSRNLEGLITRVMGIIHAHAQPDASAVETYHRKSWQADVFFRVFRRMFTIQLTTETGWWEVEDYLPLSRIVDDQYPADCFTVRIQLTPGDPAIVPYATGIHGEGYDTDQAIVRFTINPTAYLYAYSFLKDIAIKAIEIDVDVKGVKDVVLQNNLGQLDPNHPFAPFGPLPTVGSYFIVGNKEVIAKQLTHFEVEVEWAGLPIGERGFKDYYKAYGVDYDNDAFEAAVTVLNSGKWKPETVSDQSRVTLFHSDADGIAKSCRWTCGRAVRLFRPIRDKESQPTADFNYDAGQKDGFFKFTLSAPAHAFGHKDYPLRLTKVLSENAQLKKVRLHKPVPNPPYTPQIDTLSINYKANAKVNLETIGSPEESQRWGRLYHIHPFGIEHLSPQTHPAITMAPRYEADGNLFIGLSPGEFSGTLTLLFHLRDDSSLESDATPPALKWYFLAANRWQRLKNRHVLSDTTNGFLSTGIVTLFIPPHESGAGSSMPAELFWLRVCLDRHPEVPCSVYSIKAQAMEVTWLKQDGSPDRMEPILPAGTIKGSRITIPGIDRIDQIADSAGGRSPEKEDKFKARIGERLKHKYRASVPWDFERLILNRFPKIYKVKCFANMVDDPQRWDRPGHILIVVIPVLKRISQANMKPTVDGMLLKEIEEYVAGLASPFATIKVRNPSYEKIQVRCKVQFHRGKASGYYLKKLNQTIEDYLSPWNDIGYTAQFGWRVRRYDLKSYLRELDYINFVTDFSLLRVAEDDDRYYHLFDTATRQVKEILPLHPWSIAIPFKQHYLGVIENTEVVQPTVTGIDELEIGSNFIVPGKQSHVSKK